MKLSWLYFRNLFTTVLQFSELEIKFIKDFNAKDRQLPPAECNE